MLQKSHYQPPGMVLKPVVNDGISTTNLNWVFSRDFWTIKKYGSWQIFFCCPTWSYPLTVCLAMMLETKFQNYFFPNAHMLHGNGIYFYLHWPSIYGKQIVTAWNSKQPVFLWLFQLDDSKSLRKKWLFHQTSLKKWLFRVPGVYEYSSPIPLGNGVVQSLFPFRVMGMFFFTVGWISSRMTSFLEWISS